MYIPYKMKIWWEINLVNLCLIHDWRMGVSDFCKIAGAIAIYRVQCRHMDS